MLLRLKPRLPVSRRARAAGLAAVLALSLTLAGALLAARVPLPGLSPRLERATVGFAWPEFRATRPVEDPARLQQLQRAIASARRTPGQLPTHLHYWRLILEYGNGRRVTLLAHQGGGAGRGDGAAVYRRPVRRLQARRRPARHGP